ncbi:MAG: hypothetical protein Kow0069_03650 [Promethearchaeota archaeon]
MERGRSTGTPKPAVKYSRATSGAAKKAVAGVLVLAVVLLGVAYDGYLSRDSGAGLGNGQGGGDEQAVAPPDAPPPSPPDQYPDYPVVLKATEYEGPAVVDALTVEVPSSFVERHKLVTLDLPIYGRPENLTYAGLPVHLEQYRDGGYLPFLFVRSPAGTLHARLRYCFPCSTFNDFEVVDKAAVKCPACDTRWSVEDWAGVSGNCADTPPPPLPFTLGDHVRVDLGPLNVTVAP